MRRIIVAAVAGLVALTAVGCGSGTVINTAKMTDEEVKKMQQEDQQIFEQEGGKPGKAGAVKPKK